MQAPFSPALQGVHLNDTAPLGPPSTRLLHPKPQVSAMSRGGSSRLFLIPGSPGQGEPPGSGVATRVHGVRRRNRRRPT
jgi:hypothetical protein